MNKEQLKTPEKEEHMAWLKPSGRKDEDTGWRGIWVGHGLTPSKTHALKFGPQSGEIEVEKY